MRVARLVHDWGIDRLIMYAIKEKVNFLASLPQQVYIPRDIFVLKSHELWKKLEASTIIPMAKLDLNC